MTVSETAIKGLEAAMHAARLALFVINKQGVMPNSSWDSGFNSDLKIAEDAKAALTAALADRVVVPNGWRFDLENMPRDGSYLLSNDRGQVCPVQSRDGHRIMQNMVGFADWEYGSKVTAWQPLPAPPPASPAGEG